MRDNSRSGAGSRIPACICFTSPLSSKFQLMNSLICT